MSIKRLQSMGYAANRLNVRLAQAYAMAREGILPEGVIIRLGRLLRVDPIRLEEFIADGGQSLSGGWKKEGQGDAPASTN